MTTPTGDVEVVDLAAECRFVIDMEGEQAELVYRIVGGRMILVHTGVPDELSGHGIGGRLVRAALQRAAADHLTVVPWCPFARKFLHEHPEEAAAISIDWDEPPDR